MPPSKEAIDDRVGLRQISTAASDRQRIAATDSQVMRDVVRRTRILVTSVAAECGRLIELHEFGSADTATIDSPTGARITSTSVPSRDVQFALKYNF